MNRVRSLLNMRCMLPGCSLELKPNMPDVTAILVFHGTAGSINYNHRFLPLDGCLHDETRENKID